MTPFFNDPISCSQLRAESESWLGTPFALRSCVKHEGVDCVYLCAEIMRACGVISAYHFPSYTRDWCRHNDRSLLLAWFGSSERFERIDATGQPMAGDIACFHFGKCVHHAAVMQDEVRMIQALEGRSVERTQLDDSTWSKRLECFYRPLRNES